MLDAPVFCAIITCQAEWISFRINEAGSLKAGKLDTAWFIVVFK